MYLPTPEYVAEVMDHIWQLLARYGDDVGEFDHIEVGHLPDQHDFQLHLKPFTMDPEHKSIRHAHLNDSGFDMTARSLAALVVRIWFEF